MKGFKGKKTKGGKSDKTRNAKKRIKKFKHKGNYTVNEKGGIERRDRKYNEGRRVA